MTHAPKNFDDLPELPHPTQASGSTETLQLANLTLAPHEQPMSVISQPVFTRNFQVIADDITKACGLDPLHPSPPPELISDIIPRETTTGKLTEQDAKLTQTINEAQHYVFSPASTLFVDLETLHTTEYAVRYNNNPMDGIAADLLFKSNHLLQTNGIISNRLENEYIPALEQANTLFENMQKQGIISEEQALKAKASAEQTLATHRKIIPLIHEARDLLPAYEAKVDAAVLASAEQPRTRPR